MNTERLGEELKDSSPLIRNSISPDNIFTIRTPKFTDKAIQLVVKDVLKKAGLTELTYKKQVMTSHGLHKFFANQWDKAGIPFHVRELLMWHSLPGSNASYVRMTEEDRLTEYVKAIPLLTISSENKLKQQVKELGKERKDWETGLKREYELVPSNQWEALLAGYNDLQRLVQKEHSRMDRLISEFKEEPILRSF